MKKAGLCIISNRMLQVKIKKKYMVFRIKKKNNPKDYYIIKEIKLVKWNSDILQHLMKWKLLEKK